MMAQPDTINIESREELCERGKLAAIENIGKGLYHVIDYGGLAPKESQGYSSFRGYYILYNYGVKVGYGGATSTPFYDCYTELMRDSVLAKYGSNFFERAEEEVKREFAIRRKREAKSDKIFIGVDSLPQLPKSFTKIEDYLKTKIDLKFAEGGRVFISMVIEKDGSFNDLKLLRGIDEEKDKELLMTIEKMPKWKPAIVEGHIVRTRITVPITYMPQNDETK